MDLTNTLWLDAFINDELREGSYRRDRIKRIGTDIALSFLKLLDLTKQLGMISEGVNAWQKLVTKSSIHHHCSVATSTFRCAHRKPNLAQVPSDERFRNLFTASPTWLCAAADLSGIELRMLSSLSCEI